MFLTTLSWQDLKRLREVVRTVHMKHYRADHITNSECDKLIEAMGPEALESSLRRLVDND